MQPEQKLINPQADGIKYAQETQHQRKLTGDMQRKRTVFVFGEIKLAKNIVVPTDERRRRTAKKYRTKIKKPRKQNIYIWYVTEN